MSLSIIFGGYGKGKTGLLTCFMITDYLKNGEKLLSDCRAKIEEVNAEKGLKLTAPERAPYYADYSVKYGRGDKVDFEPYYINGFYFGLPNDNMQVLSVPPYSKIYLDEAQRYYNSRKSMTFPDWVSRAYEMHRHYNLDITMSVQRVMLIDKNIKDICRRFIEVVDLTHERNTFGGIGASKWTCREFDDWNAVEDYIAVKERDRTPGMYTQTEYSFRGNIFNCYDSFNYFDDFLPKKDFNYLKLSQSKEYSGEEKKYFETGEPNGFR